MKDDRIRKKKTCRNKKIATTGGYCTAPFATKRSDTAVYTQHYSPTRGRYIAFQDILNCPRDLLIFFSCSPVFGPFGGRRKKHKQNIFKRDGSPKDIFKGAGLHQNC